MKRAFAAFAKATAKGVGHPLAFFLAFLSIVVWAALGPAFKFSESWQMVVNTGTTIVTFLMVFVIQSAQNRDGAAIQAKLDELVSVGEARNEYIGAEHVSEDDLHALKERRKL